MNGAVRLFSQRTGTKVGDRIIEVGSLNVNGGVREGFIQCGEYVATDMQAGRGVDVVIKAEDLPAKYGPSSFDLVLCYETLEHCEQWKDALAGMWAVLKVGGRMSLTTPTRVKGRHNYPSDYWRWEKDDYKKIFKDQNVLTIEDVERSVGVLVEKVTEELDYSCCPYQVP